MSIEKLEEVRNELMQCRALSSNKEFCEAWLARDASYLRVLRFHGMHPSAEVFGICASKLGYYAYHLRDSNKPVLKDWSLRFTRLRQLCLDTIELQARPKWMTLRGMTL